MGDSPKRRLVIELTADDTLALRACLLVRLREVERSIEQCSKLGLDDTANYWRDELIVTSRLYGVVQHADDVSTHVVEPVRVGDVLQEFERCEKTERDYVDGALRSTRRCVLFVGHDDDHEFEVPTLDRISVGDIVHYYDDGLQHECVANVVGFSDGEWVNLSGHYGRNDVLASSLMWDEGAAHWTEVRS